MTLQGLCGFGRGWLDGAMIIGTCLNSLSHFHFPLKLSPVAYIK